MTKNRVSGRSSRRPWILVACGIVSSVLYLASIDLLAAIVAPEYHSYAYQMVSELFAAGAPTRRPLTFPMLTYNALVLAFAVGVWLSSERRVVRSLAVGLALYGGISTAGFFTPMDVRRAGGMTQRDIVHIGATVVQGVAMVATMVLGAVVHGPRFRTYSLVTLCWCVGFGMVAGAIAVQPPSPWLGTAERASIYAWMLWIAMLAVMFLRFPEARRPIVGSGSTRHGA